MIGASDALPRPPGGPRQALAARRDRLAADLLAPGQREARRRTGVFYTPDALAQDIVDAALVPLLAGRDPAQAPPLRIVDPACGAGSFLLAAYRHLLAWHRDHGPGRTLTMAERLRVLRDSIFGVDLDPRAVEVTRLSLLLLALDHETAVGSDLEDLRGNLRCGNALVDADLDWRAAFPQVFADGGFDLVVGNPPYAYRKATDVALRAALHAAYRAAEGNLDLCKLFTERAVALLRPGGTLAFLLSSSFLLLPSFHKLRRILLTETTIDALWPLGQRVFRDATVDTCVLLLRRQPPAADHRVRVAARPPAPARDIHQRRFAGNPGMVIDHRLSEEGAALLMRLFQQHPPLERRCELGVGINTGSIRAELVADERRGASYHPMVPGSGISRYGPVQTAGFIRYDAAYVRSRGDRGRTLPAEHLLSSDKILVVRTRSLALQRRVIATLDRSGAYNLNRLSNIVARPGTDLLTLLAVLNSALFQWLFSTHYFDYEIKPVYLRACPLPCLLPAGLGRLAAEMLRLHAAPGQASAAPADLQRRREALDREIDQAVFAAYGLTAAEQRVIEDAG